MFKASDAVDQFEKFESCISNFYKFSIIIFDFERSIQKLARTPVRQTKFQRYSPLDQKEIRH